MHGQAAVETLKNAREPVFGKEQLMNCAEAQGMIRPYLEKKMSDQQMQEFLDHIQHCPDCYEELEIYMAIFQTIKKADGHADPDDYNFERMMKQDIIRSRSYLRHKRFWRIGRLTVIAVAQVILIAVTAVWIGEKGLWNDEEEISSETVTESEPAAWNGNLKMNENLELEGLL